MGVRYGKKTIFKVTWTDMSVMIMMPKRENEHTSTVRRWGEYVKKLFVIRIERGKRGRRKRIADKCGNFRNPLLF